MMGVLTVYNSAVLFAAGMSATTSIYLHPTDLFMNVRAVLVVSLFLQERNVPLTNSKLYAEYTSIIMRVTLRSLLFRSFILALRYLTVETGNPVST
uniref:Uncharacterized protein n=1 Tax=Lepeophtheirus salmonis TaxID=72036 RepID=A0A0K2TAX5_LEPSM